MRNAALRQHWLDIWFAVSGTTMAELCDDIERLQPLSSRAATAGIHPRIALQVMRHPQLDPDTNPHLDPDARIRIVRAMQSLAIARPDGRAAPRQLNLGV